LIFINVISSGIGDKNIGCTTIFEQQEALA